MNPKETEPEIVNLGHFLNEFNHESDRGAALVAASMLDEKLRDLLLSFLVDSPGSRRLADGFGAPLGTLAARALAAHSLGLIQENEYEEITVIRKVRNECGHSWNSISFDVEPLSSLCNGLPWLGPADHEAEAGPRSRFNFAVAILLSVLLWRERLVKKERRSERTWPNRARS